MDENDETQDDAQTTDDVVVVEDAPDVESPSETSAEPPFVAELRASIAELAGTLAAVQQQLMDVTMTQPSSDVPEVTEADEPDMYAALELDNPDDVYTSHGY